MDHLHTVFHGICPCKRDIRTAIYIPKGKSSSFGCIDCKVCLFQLAFREDGTHEILYVNRDIVGSHVFSSFVNLKF